MASLLKPDAVLLRGAVDLSKAYCDYASTRGLIREARNTLYLLHDHKALTRKILQRYATLLERETNDAGEVTERFRSYRDEVAASAIIYGQIEIYRSGLFGSVCRPRASLFSEPGLSYTYTQPTVEDSNVELADDVRQLREDSGASMARQRWDALSVGVGSALNYLSIQGDRLIEREVSPDLVWVAYSDMIYTDADGAASRPVNENDIDEASVIVMRLAGADRYCAWYGPSFIYPHGRYVIYESDQWSNVPPVSGTDSGKVIFEARDKSGEVCNPLALYTLERLQGAGPIYPFAVAYGDKMSSGLLPVSTSLYEDCRELDIGASVVLSAGLRGAKGAQILTQTQEGRGDAVPGNMESLISLSYGWDMKQGGWPASHAKDALALLQALARQKAEEHAVPGFMAASTGIARPTSGLQVVVESEPLLRNRRERISLNRSGVSRAWAVTRALINSVDGGRKGSEMIPADMRETWNPGRYTFTLSPSEERDMLKKDLDMGVATQGEVAKTIYSLDSREKALNYLADMKEQEDEFERPLPQAASAAGANQAPGIGRMFG